MGYSVQDQNGDAKVKVNAGTDGKTKEQQTDVIIAETGYPDDHRHIVIDVNGNTVYDQIDKNH